MSAWAQVLSFVLAVLTVACGRDVLFEGDLVAGTDADTDADSDTDADTDVDADTDADTDADADADSDNDADFEMDTDVGTDLDTDLIWIAIPGGEFQMGSNESPDEEPVHVVTVLGFEMTKAETTVLQYAECVEASHCTVPKSDGGCSASEYGNWGAEGREHCPVNCVDWSQAVSFCQWAGGRLPSEAEWEYAARSGGQAFTYPWGGETATCELAVMFDGWFNYGCGTGHTMTPCARTDGNTTQGLCDVAGNGAEWVLDWYHQDYTGAPADGSAWVGSDEGWDRVYRGGSFFEDAWQLRAAARKHGDGSWFDPQLGFRCAR